MIEARPKSVLICSFTNLKELKSGIGKPYSEVTAAFLPSSLGNYHSFALVFST